MVERWRVYYLDYKLVKNVLKDQVRNDTALESFERDFINLVDAELKKVNGFFELTASQLLSELKNFLKIVTKLGYVASSNTLSYEMNRLSNELIELDKFVKVNFDGFIKIMKKHDRMTGQIALPWFRLRLKDQSFHLNKKNFSLLLLKFSSCCAACRRIMGADEQAQDIEEGGAQGFKRNTTKYWVKASDVMAIKTIVAQKLPIFVYQAHTGGAEPTDESALIWSCYYDNPDTMQLYEGRLKKTERATAIRFRVYDGSKTVFVERKTHHESWVKLSSIKERFDLPHQHVYDYTQGKFTDKHYRAYLAGKGKSVAEQDASMGLFNEIQKQIIDWKLKPTMTTKYKRTAYQIPGNATVRISLDEDLTLIKENLEYTEAQPRWRRDYESVPEEDIHRYPYAVLEVKLQTHKGVEAPEWVVDLINSALVEEAAHFSKFIQGCAMLLPERVSLLPKWFPLYLRRFPRTPPNTPQLQLAGPQYKSLSPEENEAIEEESSAQSAFSLLDRVKAAFSYAYELEGKGVVVDMKVEPKTMFANERTFIQWVSFCVILQGIGMAFQSSEHKEGRHGALSILTGEIYVLISFLFILYSFCNFRMRATRINNHQPGNYDDSFGPFFISIALVLAFFLHIFVIVGELSE